MPVLATIGAGAGILARAVGSLFGGEAKARRQARREARRGERVERREERQIAREIEDVSQPYVAPATPFYGVGAPIGVAKDIAPGGTRPPARGRGGKTDIMQTLKDNWIIVAIAAFFLLGGTKMLKPKRRVTRRRPVKPKVVYRYRTKKPATRKR